MISLHNNAYAITCRDGGAGLVLHDVKRGTDWALDEKSLVYEDTAAAPGGEASTMRKLLLPGSARAASSDTLVISYWA